MRRLLALIVASMTALPALATPPDVMKLTDRVFGIGESHVFLLRTLDDNLGQHIPGMHDVYLVEKHGITGAETLFPVSRVFRGVLSPSASGDEWKGWDIEHYPLPGAVNPFEVLAEKSAVHVRGPTDRSGYELTVTNAGLTVLDRGSPTHALDGKAKLAQLNGSIAGTAKFIPPYPWGGEIQSTSTIPFPQILSDQSYALSECAPDHAQSLSARRSEESIMVVLLRCAREWESQTLIVVVPAVP